MLDEMQKVTKVSHSFIWWNSYKKITKAIVFFVSALIITVISIVIYSLTIQKLLLDTTETNLIEMTTQFAHSVDVKIEEELRFLNAYLENNIIIDLSLEEQLKYLALFAERNGYSRVFISKLDGSSVGNDYKEINFFDNPYFQLAKKGVANMSKPFFSAIDQGEVYVAFFVPIYQNGKIVNILAATRTAQKIENVITYPLYNNKGNTHVLDKSGEVIIHSSCTDVCDLLQTATVDNYSDENNSILEKLYDGNDIGTINQLLDNIKNDVKGTSNILIGGKRYFVAYTPIEGVNDWLVFANIEAKDVFSNSRIIINMTLLLCVIIVIILIIAYIFVFLERRKSEKHIIEEAQVYKTVIEENVDLIFECDIQSDKIEFYITDKTRILFMRMYGEDASKIMKNSEHMAFFESRIHNEDKIDFEKSFITTDEQNHLVKECRYKTVFNDEYIWIRIISSRIRDESGNIKKTIVSINDINEQKMKEIKLTNAAELDLMTRLFNKATTIEKIDEYLLTDGKGSSHAVLMIDIDNFKKINECYGNGFGDQLIIKFAAGIKNSFYAQDIIGRVGGDEFLVLMKHYKNISSLKFKVNKMLEYLYNDVDNEIYAYSLSASVGIARYPEDGNDFRELIQKADLAMYQAKMLGKNTFCLYNDTTEDTFSNYNYSKDIARRLSDLTLSFENTMDGMLICVVNEDENMIKCINVNTSYLILHGIANSQIEGVVLSTLHDNYMENLCEQIYQCVKKKTNIVYKDTFFVDNKEYVVEESINVIMYDDKNHYVIISEHDVTEIFVNERRRKRLIKEYDILLQSAHDGIAMLKFDEAKKQFKHVRANTRYYGTYGLTEQDDLTKLDTFLTKTDVQMMQSTMVTGKDNLYTQKEIINGQKKILIISIVPYVEENKVKYLVLNSKDVTKEHVLREEKDIYAERFKALLNDETSINAVIEQNDKGEIIIVDCNPYFASLVGKTSVELYNHNILELEGKVEASIILDSYYFILREKRPYFVEFYDSYNKKHFNLTAYPVFRNKEVITVVFSARDVEQLKKKQVEH